MVGGANQSPADLRVLLTRRCLLVWSRIRLPGYNVGHTTRIVILRLLYTGCRVTLHGSLRSRRFTRNLDGVEFRNEECPTLDGNIVTILTNPHQARNTVCPIEKSRVMAISLIRYDQVTGPLLGLKP